jgi:uncharacterized MAPEG superfamily protein
MPPELTVLALAGLLQLAQFVAMSVPANLELGAGKTLGPRDRTQLGGALEDQLSEKTARLLRALDNHFEGLILFTLAVVVVTLSGQSTGFTQSCAWVYLGARIAYVPAYYFGLSPWRSLIWFTGFCATTAMIVATLI